MNFFQFFPAGLFRVRESHRASYPDSHQSFSPDTLSAKREPSNNLMEEHLARCSCDADALADHR
jgi:hypothetical protein